MCSKCGPVHGMCHVFASAMQTLHLYSALKALLIGLLYNLDKLECRKTEIINVVQIYAIEVESSSFLLDQERISTKSADIKVLYNDGIITCWCFIGLAIADTRHAMHMLDMHRPGGLPSTGMEPILCSCSMW